MKNGNDSSHYKKHLKKMQRDTPLVYVSLNDLPIQHPAPPSSPQTREELKTVSTSVAGLRGDEIEILKNMDENPLVLFKRYADNNGLHFNEKYFYNLLKQLQTLILQLKYFYNRPRPSQVANKANIPFNYYDLHSANSPSYPSGHAIQAFVLANILGFLYPSHDENLYNIAEMISLSRVKLGVHFPSDLEFGRLLADIISDNVELPEKVLGVYENNFRSIVKNFIAEGERSRVKLRILDFDDTIAHTVERVRVDYPGGHKMISSEDFADYSLKEGEYFHPELAFEEFKSVDVDRAMPVPFISDLLKKFATAEGDRKILILTARGDEVRDTVMSFLNTRLGIENPEGKIDFKGVASKDPIAKVAVIQQNLKDNPDIDFVSFFDDSGSNVKAVKAFIDVLNTDYRQKSGQSNISSDIRQVIKDEETGSYNLRHPEYDEGEDIDYREMARNFLTGDSD